MVGTYSRMVLNVEVRSEVTTNVRASLRVRSMITVTAIAPQNDEYRESDTVDQRLPNILGNVEELP